MLYVKGDKGQLINLNRAVVIDAVFNEDSKKWEVQAYFTETFCDVIRSYEIEDQARQCVAKLCLQLGQWAVGSILEFSPCISANVVKVPSSSSNKSRESTESSD